MVLSASSVFADPGTKTPEATATALANANIINKQSDVSGYNIANNVTRAEIAKVVANLGGYSPTSCAGNIFADVGAKQNDLCGYIEALADAGVVTTTNSRFRPLDNISRAEMVKMVMGVLGEDQSTVPTLYKDVSSDLGDLYGFVNRAYAIGCTITPFGGAGNFYPTRAATRGQTFQIAACASSLDLDDAGNYQ